MPQTWGVPVAEIERGIRYGVRKVNIDTDCRMAMSGAMRRYALQHPDVFDPRKFILAAKDELETLVRDRFERFGTAGHAHQIKPLPPWRKWRGAIPTARSIRGWQRDEPGAFHRTVGGRHHRAGRGVSGRRQQGQGTGQ